MDGNTGISRDRPQDGRLPSDQQGYIGQEAQAVVMPRKRPSVGVTQTSTRSKRSTTIAATTILIVAGVMVTSGVVGTHFLYGLTHDDPQANSANVAADLGSTAPTEPKIADGAVNETATAPPPVVTPSPVAPVTAQPPAVDSAVQITQADVSRADEPAPTAIGQAAAPQPSPASLVQQAAPVVAQATAAPSQEPADQQADATTPRIQTAPEQRAAISEPPSEKINGRSVLRPAAGLAVYRIPRDQPGVAPGVPVTDSLTIYQRWAVACESRSGLKSCFASAFVKSNAAIMKMRLGPAAPMAGNGQAGAGILRDGAGRPRYVMTIEGPPGLDEPAGLSVAGSNAFGILPLVHGCTEGSCVASAFVMPSEGTPAKVGLEDSIAVTGTVGERGYVWRFSGLGLNDAFARVRQEMEDPAGPPLTVVDSTDQAEKQAVAPRRGGKRE